MDRKETPQQRMTRVAREISSTIRRQARGRWAEVKTAERNEPGRHVWRFQSATGGDDRFLHIEHRAMVQGKNPAARLLQQLDAERWMDRLQQEPAMAILLSRDGQLAAYPQA